MEYQKVINLLQNKQNKPSKCRTRNWVEKNYESQGTYKASIKNEFKLQ